MDIKKLPRWDTKRAIAIAAKVLENTDIRHLFIRIAPSFETLFAVTPSVREKIVRNAAKFDEQNPPEKLIAASDGGTEDKLLHPEELLYVWIRHAYSEGFVFADAFRPATPDPSELERAEALLDGLPPSDPDSKRLLSEALACECQFLIANALDHEAVNRFLRDRGIRDHPFALTIDQGILFLANHWPDMGEKALEWAILASMTENI